MAQSMHQNKTIKCPYCGLKFTKIFSLKTHIQSIHEGKIFQCQDCDYKAIQNSHLKTHIQSTHEGIAYRCQHCDDVFTYDSIISGNTLSPYI